MSPIEIIAKGAYEQDWPKDTWERLGPGYHQDRYLAMARAGLTALRTALAEKRGDPRGYGQGFHDPLGAKIAALDSLLGLD